MEAARRWQDSRVILEDPDSTYIDEGVAIGPGTVIGPNTHLKGRTRIGSDCRIDGSAYLTDAEIGDRVQVGSDTTLVAPVTLGDDSYVATATTVRHDVPAGSLVYNERRERVREGWTEQKRERMKRGKGKG